MFIAQKHPADQFDPPGVVRMGRLAGWPTPDKFIPA
jgi:hypothetical protein